MKNARKLSLPASLLVILLVLVACSVDASTQTRSNNNRSGAKPGMFKVWVPAGIIGDKYWIYLDGHIVGAPPHATSDPTTPRKRYSVSPTPDGWEIVAEDHSVTLEIIHENWTPNVLAYTDSGDPLHLFQGFIFALQPGRHTIELAIFQSDKDVPFVFTGKWARDIHQGGTTQIHVAVPDHWTNISARAYPAQSSYTNGNTVCSFDTPTPPDDVSFGRLYQSFNADPRVNALRGVDASSLLQPKGVAVLDLPAELGGSHEFDRRQIGEIAQAVNRDYPLPSLRDVAECQQHFPLLSSSYGVYGEMVKKMSDLIRPFLIMGR